MPMTRFEKMPEVKKEQILEAAAKEMAEYGYENASLNRILEQAGISKGAAYYYFEDKADLIATVLRHYWLDFMDDPVSVFEGYGADDFWDRLAELYLHPFDQIEERPWMLGFSRAVWQMPPGIRTSGPLGAIWEEAMVWLKSFLDRGRAVGAIRDDLPDGLMIELIMALDNVHDRWLAEHWEEMDRLEFENFTALFVDFMKKALERPSEQQAGDNEGGLQS